MLVSGINLSTTACVRLCISSVLALFLSACGGSSNDTSPDDRLSVTVIPAIDVTDNPIGSDGDSESEDKPDSDSDDDETDDSSDDNDNDNDNDDPTDDDSDDAPDDADLTALSLIDVPLADRDLAGNRFFTTNNNTARLQGAVIGNGSLINQAVHRRVRVLQETASGNTNQQSIAIKQVYLARQPGGFANLTAVVHNRSDDWHCDIQISDVQLNNALDEPLVNQLFNTTLLSVMSLGRTNDGVTNKACLAPDERGYAIMTGNFNHRDVASVNIGSINTAAGNPLPHDDRVEPVSYEISNNDIRFLVANRSAVAVTINSAAIVMLDAGGLPLSNGVILASLNLSPGEETVISVPIGFEGSASNARLVVDANPQRTPEPIDQPEPIDLSLAIGNTVEVPLRLQECGLSVGSRVSVNLENIRVIDGPSDVFPFLMAIRTDQIATNGIELLVPVRIHARRAATRGVHDLRFTVVTRDAYTGATYCSNDQNLLIDIVQ